LTVLKRGIHHCVAEFRPGYPLKLAGSFENTSAVRSTALLGLWWG